MDFISSEYESTNDKRQVFLDDLKNIVINSNSYLEGNCFYHHQSFHIYPELYTKQLNLFWCGKQANINLCEIGFNAGHSAMLMLLGRDITPLKYENYLNFTVFDIGHHPYTVPCYEYIKDKFSSHVRFEYIEGDSTITMPDWINKHNELVGKYDVVHVDGGHTEHCISNDMINADILVKVGGIVIVDDTNDATINKYVDLYISGGGYIELKLLETHGYKHRVIKKVLQK